MMMITGTFMMMITRIFMVMINKDIYDDDHKDIYDDDHRDIYDDDHKPGTGIVYLPYEINCLIYDYLSPGGKLNLSLTSHPPTSTKRDRPLALRYVVPKICTFGFHVIQLSH